jgi:hypothetical protein
VLLSLKILLVAAAQSVSGTMVMDVSATPTIDMNTVTLRQFAGGSEISGQLVSFGNGVFVLDTEVMGRVQIHADTAMCYGNACPHLY